MKSIEIANALIARHGGEISLTNLKLNKLVYYVQVESVRESGDAIFDDEIEAWQYGPVERAVYDVFKRNGRSLIACPCGPCAVDDRAIRLVDIVASTYGMLSTFDLVELSHKDGGAWSKVYSPQVDNVISVDDILSSTDMDGFPGFDGTAVSVIKSVTDSIPNALSFLRNS